MLQIFFYAGPVLAFSLYLFVELYFISLRFKTDIRKNIRAWTVVLTAAGVFVLLLSLSQANYLTLIYAAAVFLLIPVFMIRKVKLWKRLLFGAAFALFQFAAQVVSSMIAFPDHSLPAAITSGCLFNASLYQILLLIGIFKPVADTLAAEKNTPRIRLMQYLLILIFTVFTGFLYYMISGDIETIGTLGTVLIMMFYVVIVLFEIFVMGFLIRMDGVYAEDRQKARNEHKKKYEAAYYDLVKEQYVKSATQMDEWKTMLTELKELFEDQDSSEVKGFTKNSLDEISAGALPFKSGDRMLAILIEDTKQRAAKNGTKIEASCRTSLPRQLEDYDKTVIFGNLLDNAVEASACIPDAVVRIDVDQIGNMINIVVENPMTGRPKRNRLGLVSSKPGIEHGFGLKNVEKAVRKYGGSIDIDTKNQSFRVNILLPGTKSAEEAPLVSEA